MLHEHVKCCFEKVLEVDIALYVAHTKSSLTKFLKNVIPGIKNISIQRRYDITKTFLTRTIEQTERRRFFCPL